MKIAIIGGGQLGMMMAEEAKKLGHIIYSLDPNPNCSITKFSDCHIAKEYNDEEVLQYMYENVDVITYEFENVDLNVLSNYLDKIPQKLDALRISRNRIVEKNYAKSLGIQTPAFTKVYEKEDIFFPSIVKTITGGYDGKGQYVVKSKHDVDRIDKKDTLEYICEEHIQFDYEISVVATRDRYGTTRCFPIPKNIHKNGILHISKIDEKIPSSIKYKAEQYATKIIEDLDYIGTLAVEFFVRGEEVLFNEFAPRPHNSGHYTMDGCNISQFASHILAITNEKLPEISLIEKTIMINVLGQYKHFYSNSKSMKNSFIHDYYKNSTRENRKIGHINVLYNNDAHYNKIIRKIIEE